MTGTSRVWLWLHSYARTPKTHSLPPAHPGVQCEDWPVVARAVEKAHPSANVFDGLPTSVASEGAPNPLAELANPMGGYRFMPVFTSAFFTGTCVW